MPRWPLLLGGCALSLMSSLIFALSPPPPLTRAQGVATTITEIIAPTLVLAPTPTLSPVAIQPNNAAQVRQLARWGGNAAGTELQLIPAADGHTLALAGTAGVGLYDPATFQETQRLTLNTPVRSAALSPAADHLALATTTELQVWQLATPTQWLTIPLSVTTPITLAWRPDATQLALATTNTLQLFDLPTGTLTRTLQAAPNLGLWHTLVFSADGQRLIAGGPRGVQTWDTGTGRTLETYRPPAGAQCHSTAAAQALLLACTNNAPAAQTQVAVRVFQVDTGQLMHNTTLAIGSGGLALSTPALSVDGARAAWQVTNGEVQVWDLTHNNRLFTYNPGQRVHGLALPGQTLTLLLASERVLVWNLSTFTLQSQYTSAAHNIPLTSLALHPTQPLVAVGQADGAIKIWNWATGQLQRQLAPAAKDVYWPRIAGLAFSPDGLLLAAASWAPNVRVWYWHKASTRPLFTAVPADFAQAIAFSPDGVQVLSGERAGRAEARYPATGHLLWATLFSTTVQAWALHPSQDLLATFDLSGTVRLSTLRGALLHTASFSPTAQPALAFSPEGQWLAIAGATLHLWNVRTLAQVDLSPHSVHTLTFNCNGSLLALGVGPDIVLLEPHTHTTWTLTGHTKPITALAFTPDCTQLVSTSADATLRVWGMVE